MTVSVTQGDLPTQVKVTINRSVKNMFGGLVGAKTTTIGKHAVGEYEAPANMGSPINQFGNDPTQASITHGSTTYPDMWANVFGPSSDKAKGDAIQAKVCATGGTDNCSVSNTDYDPDGYFYGVDVPDGSNGTLNFQAFDPEFAHVGDNCGDNDTSNGAPGTNLVAAAALAPNFNPQFAVSEPVGPLRHRGRARTAPATSSTATAGTRTRLRGRRSPSAARTTRRPTRPTTRSSARSTSRATWVTSRTR